MAEQQEYVVHDDGLVEELVDDKTEEESTEGQQADSSAQAEDDKPAREESGEGDEDREGIRARRREERQHKRKAQRTREDSLRRELSAQNAVIGEMRERLAAFERRNSGADVATIDAAIKQTADAYYYFKDQIRVASEAGNHAALAEATEKMTLAQRRADELARIRQAYAANQSRPQPLDPRLASHAQEWLGRNGWYDPTGRDQDSRIAMQIDRDMAEQGWDPTTGEYWSELDSRLKKYLPHRLNSGYNKQRPNNAGGPVAGSGRGEGGGSGGETYNLSPERIAAMKEAGVWDDTQKRAAMIKRYRDFDRSQA